MTNSESASQFPGPEFSLVHHSHAATEYFYEIYRMGYGQTTLGRTAVLPFIEHRTQVISATSAESWDDSTVLVPESILIEPQRAALERARDIKDMRQRQDPGLPTFSYLREVGLASNGWLYVAEPTDDSLAPKVPYAAVRTMRFLEDIEFATAVWGHPMMFRWYNADIASSISEEKQGEASAYRFIDTPRVVIGAKGEQDFQIARLRLYAVEVDLDFPLRQCFTD